MDPTTIGVIVALCVSGSNLLLVVGLRVLDTYLLHNGYTAQELQPITDEIAVLSPAPPRPPPPPLTIPIIEHSIN